MTVIYDTQLVVVVYMLWVASAFFDQAATEVAAKVGPKTEDMLKKLVKNEKMKKSKLYKNCILYKNLRAHPPSKF